METGLQKDSTSNNFNLEGISLVKCFPKLDI
jgi:hypothetical protein